MSSAVELNDTEIGFLPKDWELFTIDELFEIKQGKALNKKRKEGRNQKPFLRTSNVFWGEIKITKLDTMHFEEEEVKKLKLKINDILVCEGGDVGRTAIWNNELKECLYQNHLHRLRPKSDVVFPLFYIYWMQYAILRRGLYVGVANRTTIPNLSRTRLSQFIFPLPPLIEQCNIAFILTTVQEAIKKTEAVIQATQELKKSLMNHLFTYGPVPITEREQVQLKETEIGEIPEEWNVVILEDVAEITMGQSPPGSSYNNLGDGIPFLQGKAEFGDLSPKHDKYTNDPKKIGKEGSVLMSVRAPVGDVNLANIDYCIGRGLSAISMNKGNNNFLFYSLIHLKKLIQKEGTGSTFKAITKSKLTNFKIANPSYEMQNEIARILMSVERKIQTEKEKNMSLKLLFTSLLDSLMTGKIRVKDLNITNLKAVEAEL